MASTLVEIKSRMLLPRQDEIEDPLEDPRHDLVERLLEYKKFKDAASMLEERGREWQQRYRARGKRPAAARRATRPDEPIHEVELWDLVSAFGRILRENIGGAAGEHPLRRHADPRLHEPDLCAAFARAGGWVFSELLRPPMHRSTLIGLFLAVLELVRHHGVVVEQVELFGEIWLVPGETGADGPVDFSTADDYSHGGAKADAEANE